MPKILVDHEHEGRWVKAWKEKGSFIIQIWNSGKPEGDPDGDWEMPVILGLSGSIEQALLQTDK